MNLIETGKLIADSRKQLGYTQIALAEILGVTDKAVSKWERGICLPDASLLTQISMLLDIDIDYLVSGSASYSNNKWRGEIRVNSLKGEVAGKPVLHYLLSYFMLAGITDISIITEDKEYIKNMHLEQYGLNISFSSVNVEKTMIVYDKFILYGVNLTRQLQHCMTENGNICLTLNNKNIPIVFSHWNVGNSADYNVKISQKKSLGRGTVFIPLQLKEDVENASNFVRICEKYNSKIADLYELSKNRGLV